jgi:hypothetical protein
LSTLGDFLIDLRDEKRRKNYPDVLIMHLAELEYINKHRPYGAHAKERKVDRRTAEHVLLMAGEIFEDVGRYSRF